MKNEKKITETKQGNGVYIMDYKKETFQVRGSNAAERLGNAVKDFLHMPKEPATHTRNPKK